jgi:hypothetical protein
MLLLRRVKLRLAQRAGLKRQVNLVKPVAASITRAVVKAAAGSVSISSRENLHERFKRRVLLLSWAVTRLDRSDSNRSVAWG